jgi:outer membrane protein assembly factor BamB
VASKDHVGAIGDCPTVEIGLFPTSSFASIAKLMEEMKRRNMGLVFVGVIFAAVILQAAAADWPQWRGPNRDGHVAGGEVFPEALPATPKPIWQKSIGGGFSSPVIQGGKLLYLDTTDGRETAHLVDSLTGTELWHVDYAAEFGDEWGNGPRSTPIIDQDRAYVQSCDGEFRCLSLADGKTIWRANFDKDFGAHFLGNHAIGNEGVASRRGNNGCGVVDGDRIYVPAGATNGASLVCFDKKTGKVLWKSQNEEAAYSALMAATLAGSRQILYFAADSLMGVDAASGKLLWRQPLRTNAKRHAASPVIFGDCVMVNSHTFGLICFEIKRKGDGFEAEEKWANRQMKINIATPTLADRWLYSQGPGNELVCVDAITGKLAWTQPGFGEKYSAILTDGKRLLIATDRGELVLAAADPLQFKQLGRVQICGKAWQHPAWAEGKLYVREGLTSGWKLSCFDFSRTL